MFRMITAVCLVLSGLAMADIDRTREQCTTWQDDCAGRRVQPGSNYSCPYNTTQAALPSFAFGSTEPVSADPSDAPPDTPEQPLADPWQPPFYPGAAVPDTFVPVEQHSTVRPGIVWASLALP